MLEWAKEELNRIEKDEDGMQEWINEQILDLVEVFSKQGHSGSSSFYVAEILTKLLKWQPIIPLTGAEDEWQEAYNNVEQNKRCPFVFRKNKDNSTAYDSNSKVFSDNGGETWYSCKESHIPISFPYNVPETPEHVLLGQ